MNNLENVKHGTKRLAVELDLYQLNAVPFNNPEKPTMLGKFGLICQQSEYNTSGVFALTEKQLKQIAQGLGMSNPRPLARAVAKGGCKLITNWIYCKEDEPVPGVPGRLFTKDHWRREEISIDLSDAAQKYIDEINAKVDVINTQETEAKALQSARDLRRKAILAQMGVTDDVAEEAEEAEDVAEEQEEQEEAAPVAKKPAAKRTTKKK